ncbi:MAG: 6,7-dimethyl-8-ribityllumazine synthase 1, partial [Alphaproteobacteria bacterium MarineAlpha2_Bin1]
MKILIVESRFYSEISDQLLLGVKRELDSKKILFEVVSVPGALEIAQAMNIIISKDIQLGKEVGFDGFIALGCVIRGETSHYD